MKRLRDCQIRFGRVEGVRFAPSNTPGDWMPSTRVDFDTPFVLPAAGPQPAIRVIVTPFHRFGAGVQTYPVPFVDEFSTDAGGFTLGARNACPRPSNPREAIGFTYVALCEVAPVPVDGVVPVQMVSVRFGVAQPWFYEAQPEGYIDDPDSAILNARPFEQAQVPLRPPLRLAPTSVVLTAASLYAEMAATTHAEQGAAVTPVLTGNNVRGDRFSFDSFSTDLAPGATAFNWASFIHDPNEPSRASGNLVVDSGHSDDGPNRGYPGPNGAVGPSGLAGDWGYRHVYFSEPFSTPPIVLMTARNGPDVAVAAHVTPWGFTGAMRNSDVNNIVRPANFDWVAIACAPGCLSEM